MYSRGMEIVRSFFAKKYLLVMWLSLSLIFALITGVHMHVQHNDHYLDVPEHFVSKNVELIQYEMHEAVGHHEGTVDVSLDSLLKKLSSISILVFIFLSSCLLITPVRQCYHHRRSFKARLIFFIHQLHPPLRAPPVHLHNSI